MLDQGHLFHRLANGARVAALHKPRIESFRKENDLLAAGEHAQRPCEAAEEIDLAFDAAAIELIVETLLSALNFFHEVVDAETVGVDLDGNGRRRIERLRAADLQRIARSEVDRTGDRRR